MPMERRVTWKIISQSVNGPSHVRLGLPNQDCVRERQNDVTMVAVSDGHGSAKCFRSEIGARFAAESALDVIESFFSGDWADSSFGDKSGTITKEITQEWRKKVDEHLQKSPFTQDERDRLALQYGQGTFSQIEKHPPIAYGATLITVAISADYIVFLQLGDGDILAVDESGEVRRPIRSDDRLFANETTSLSSETAWNDFRTCIQFLPRGLPALILLSTDGYSNSFKDEASFLKAGSDFLAVLRSDGGIEDVEKSLKEWLTESSQMSGDDVTLSLVYRQSPELESSRTLIATSEREIDCQAAPNDGGDASQNRDICDGVGQSTETAGPAIQTLPSSPSPPESSTLDLATGDA